MPKYTAFVYLMCIEALVQLGGIDKCIPLKEIVRKVRENYPKDDVNEGTIRDQIFRFCINRHPSHDHFPDKGKRWKEEPLFVTDSHGGYRRYNIDRDKEIYNEEVKRDEGLN